MSNYYVLTLLSVQEIHEDGLTEILFSHGAQGVSEDLVFSQSLDQYEPVVVPQNEKNLKAYFDSSPGEALLKSLDAKGISWRLTEEPQKDWLAEWKKGFTAFALTDDFWIVPRWEEIPEKAHHFFHIEPGMAFGTGTHETTQLVMETMAKSSRLQPDLSFLDVGTGSGLLAFYALKQGYRRILALDNDPEALRVAQENLDYNKASEVELSSLAVGELTETFDVVVANIIQSVLVRLRSGLVRAVRPGGQLILSGVLKDHESEFMSDFLATDELALIERSQKGDWICLRVERK